MATRSPSAPQVFAGDVRLVLAALNEGRHLALHRAFGVSRDQANLLTFALALTAADGAWVTTQRVVHAPFPVSRTDATLGGMLVREAALSIAGPAARKVPNVGTLLALAMLGGLAAPGLRRGVHGLRAAEARIRARRMSIYAAADRAASTVRDATPA